MMKSKYIYGILIILAFLFLIASDVTGWKVAFPYHTTFWISRFLIWLLLLLVFLYSKFVEKGDFLFIKGSRRKWWFFPLAIVALYGIIMVAYIPIGLLEKYLGFSNDSPDLKKMLNLFCKDKLLLVFTCITAGVTEELLFRGYILSRLKLLTNSNWIAVAGSAILFASAHFRYGTMNEITFPLLVGVAFGIFYIRYKNMATLILCHTMIDLISTWGACS